MNRPTATTARQRTFGRGTKKIAGKAVNPKRSAAKRSGGNDSRPMSMTTKFTAQQVATTSARTAGRRGISVTSPPQVRPRSLLPGEVPEHRNSFAVGGDAVDLHLGRADHEVDVPGAHVCTLAVFVLDEEREAVAERDVARCVLVQQRVKENSVERADPPLAVDDRELTEPARTLVYLGEATKRLCVLVGIDLDRNAIFKANGETADDRPVIEDERLRRGDVPARATGVRRREDLLAREVREMPQPFRGREVDSRPGRSRQQADPQLGSRPAHFDRVEAALGQPRRVVAQHRHALVPGGERVRLVEAQDVLKLTPELLVRLVCRQVWMDE